MKRNFIISLLLLIPILPSYSFAIGYNEWMSNIDTSCKLTISGKFSETFIDNKLWSNTLVSMDMWATKMRQDKPDEYCFTDPGMAIEKRPDLLQCLAVTRNKWDWYNRCHEIVNLKSKNIKETSK